MTIDALPRGIDVSSNNGSIDWTRVATAGLTFAFIKVTEDDGYLNPNFAHDWLLSGRVGLVRGAYHFARPEGTDAVVEADYFLDQIDAHGGLAPGDLLALDLESGAGDLGQWALDFLHRCEARTGFKPLVYTGAWFSGPHNFAAYPALGDYGLWLAAYQASMPPAPAPWSFPAFWQYSDAGSVPGISGGVDMNVFNGPAENIRLYGKPGTAPAPVPVPPAYSVGPGILTAMTAYGDRPATDEMFTKRGEKDEWSEAFGQPSGARYVWVTALGRAFRFAPAA